MIKQKLWDFLKISGARESTSLYAQDGFEQTNEEEKVELFSAGCFSPEDLVESPSSLVPMALFFLLLSSQTRIIYQTLKINICITSTYIKKIQGDIFFSKMTKTIYKFSLFLFPKRGTKVQELLLVIKVMTNLVYLCEPSTIHDQWHFIPLSRQMYCLSEVNSNILCVREKVFQYFHFLKINFTEN